VPSFPLASPPHALNTFGPELAHHLCLRSRADSPAPSLDAVRRDRMIRITPTPMSGFQLPSSPQSKQLQVASHRNTLLRRRRTAFPNRTCLVACDPPARSMSSIRSFALGFVKRSHHCLWVFGDRLATDRIEVNATASGFPPMRNNSAQPQRWATSSFRPSRPRHIRNGLRRTTVPSDFKAPV